MVESMARLVRSFALFYHPEDGFTEREMEVTSELEYKKFCLGFPGVGVGAGGCMRPFLFL
jgi:hypothetical protein